MHIWLNYCGKMNMLLQNQRVMKTNDFSKRILVVMAIAFLCCFSVTAQNSKEWSIIPFAKIGYVLDGTVDLDEVYHVNAGVDAKVSFNKHWSLLTGVEYNYRWGFNTLGSWFSEADRREGLRHFIRIPVRAEFTYKWFYADAGMFVERATNSRYDANETIDFGIGPEVELGGRIRLAEKDRLRIGLQIQGCDNFKTKEGQSSFGGGFFGTFLTMGYEHRF